ncbi:WD domain, G-beta repeat [Musa troglodytarum]|uniref:WD domain, G-beta repeat n=1 Tax=Musa troglodytarum TaxID=320322 RepID=A0A9E7HAL3_9LILI|nr:WD domain, G-beta repeat [Musa troglodytarum]
MPPCIPFSFRSTAEHDTATPQPRSLRLAASTASSASSSDAPAAVVFDDAASIVTLPSLPSLQSSVPISGYLNTTPPPAFHFCLASLKKEQGMVHSTGPTIPATVKPSTPDGNWECCLKPWFDDEHSRLTPTVSVLVVQMEHESGVTRLHLISKWALAIVGSVRVLVILESFLPPKAAHSSDWINGFRNHKVRNIERMCHEAATNADQAGINHFMRHNVDNIIRSSQFAEIELRKAVGRVPVVGPKQVCKTPNKHLLVYSLCEDLEM